MADEVLQGEGTEGQEAQTVTIEQFEAVTAQLEETNKMFEDLKRSQSGSDAAVTKLQKLLEQKDKEIENEKKTLEQRTADEIAEIRAELQQEKAAKMYEHNKGLATQMLIDADLRIPRTLSRLIGKDEEETMANIQAYIEDRQDDNAKAKDKEAKKYGRKVVDTTQKTVEKMSYEDMANLSDEQFNAIPKDVVIKAMNAALGAKQ